MPALINEVLTASNYETKTDNKTSVELLSIVVSSVMSIAGTIDMTEGVRLHVLIITPLSL